MGDVLAPTHPAASSKLGSRQPQPSVVADVWLCHGNARTGCTSGLQQGQAHAHRPPTPSSPKACCEEPLGSRWGQWYRAGGRQRWHPPWGSAVRRGGGEEKEDTRVHSPAEALLWQLAAASPLPTEDAKETAWEEELPSTGLVCGRLIAVFPTITVAPHGGRALCQTCAAFRSANNILHVHGSLLCAADTAHLCGAL